VQDEVPQRPIATLYRTLLDYTCAIRPDQQASRAAWQLQRHIIDDLGRLWVSEAEGRDRHCGICLS
jgi:hypothetical protein